MPAAAAGICLRMLGLPEVHEALLNKLKQHLDERLGQGEHREG